MELLFDGKPGGTGGPGRGDEAEPDDDRPGVEAGPGGSGSAWVTAVAGAWTADGLGRIELRSEKGKAVFDAGEWKVTFGKKTDRDGTVKLVTTSAPLAGFELIPRDKDGRKVLVLDDEQHSYVFERAAK